MPVVHRDARATCRPSISATDRLHEHDREPSDPAACCGVTTAQWMAWSLAGTPAELPQVRGCYRRLSLPLQPPCRRPRADTDLPQPDRLRHPMSLADTLRSLENRARRAAGRITGLSCCPWHSACHETALDESACQTSRTPKRTACPVGPSSAAARESDRSRLHPRCLPPTRPLCRPSRPSAVDGPDPAAGNNYLLLSGSRSGTPVAAWSSLTALDWLPTPLCPATSRP